MRFLHLGLVVSLVLSTKASDDPNHDDSVSENPTGRATVHGHPKVAAGFGRQKPIAETPLMSSEADSEEHTMPPVMTEDNTLIPSEEQWLKEMFRELSFHPTIKDKFICFCAPIFDSRGQGDCNLQTRDFNGREWCYLSRTEPPQDVDISSDCSDAKPSRELDGFFWSHAACDTKPQNPCLLCPPNVNVNLNQLLKLLNGII